MRAAQEKRHYLKECYLNSSNFVAQVMQAVIIKEDGEVTSGKGLLDHIDERLGDCENQLRPVKKNKSTKKTTKGVSCWSDRVFMFLTFFGLRNVL